MKPSGIKCRTWEACWADKHMQYSYDRGVFEGAAILHGFVGMGEALAENDSIRACPHCGVAPSAKVYCEHAMCDPAVCHYWVCFDCDEAGRGHDKAAQVSGVAEKKA